MAVPQETQEISQMVESIDVNADEDEENPWQEQAERTHISIHRLQTPDPRELEQELARIQPSNILDESSLASAEDKRERRTSAEVLELFDPLANSVELNAKAAWVSADGHPPLAQEAKPSESRDLPGTPDSPSERRPLTAPSPPRSSSGETNASSSLAFPSFSSLAKSFTLPSKARSRSVDAKAEPSVLSPTSISSFASQQQFESPTDRGKGKQPESSISGQEEARSTAPPAAPGLSKGGDENPLFDFQKFLDQLKSRSAEAVAKYLRSFLANFSKRSLTVNEQIKVVNDFLHFISIKMRENDVWRTVTDAEFDMAMEAMEKLVMNRLYEFTFTPQLREAVPPRRITTDDLERDRVLGQRIALFGWIEEKHLDIPEGPETRGFLMFAQQELLKINHYKAPRDKLICILNCCKVIFGLIRHLHKEENADSFVPILIYVVLQANPPNLVSNIEYINRFRNPEKLQSEAGYYLSSLMGAVSFVETMDHSSLSHITAEEFERNVEVAISNLPGSPVPSDKAPSPDLPQTPPRTGGNAILLTSPHAGEESAQPLSLSLGQGLTGLSLAEGTTRRFLQRTGDTLSKPLSALGRMLGEVMDGLDRETGTPASSSQAGVGSYLPGPFAPLEISKERARDVGQEVRPSSLPSTPLREREGASMHTQAFQAPYKTRVRNIQPRSGLSTPGTPASGRSTPDITPSRTAPMEIPYRDSSNLALPSRFLRASSPTSDGLDSLASMTRTPSPGLDIPGLQAEIDQAHERAATEALGSLSQMFPTADREVLEWVLEAEQGDLGRSIEKMLEITETS